MNKRTYLICLLLFFIACNSDKKQANNYLVNAQKLYAQSEYASAKSQLDSINELFPKEFGVRKQSLQLKRRIETKEQEQHLIFCDSMLNIRLAEFEAMKSGFVFEKDLVYDDIGKYLDKNQQIEVKLQSSYIRTQVNEQGEILFSSVYYGSRPIRHSRLKVSKSNGDYMETLNIPYDGGLNYTFADEGMTTEVVTYTQGKDNGVIQFIYNNKESALKAELSGNGKAAFTISAVDKNALIKIYDFATVLADIDKLKKEIEKSSHRLIYLEAKLATDDE